jgi:hypothetical protein
MLRGGIFEELECHLSETSATGLAGTNAALVCFFCEGTYSDLKMSSPS